MTRREELINWISDGHKDAYGFRPRHYNYSEMTIDQLEKLATEITAAVEIAIDEADAKEKAANDSFEKLIEDVISYGAGDRKTAIRWIVDGYDEDFHNESAGYICYCFGISYDYKTEITTAIS